MFACVINQNAPHHPRGNAEEVGTVLPGDAVLSHQPQVRLVDERRGL